MIFKWASPEDIKRLAERIKTKFSELGAAAFLNLAENFAVTEKGKFVPDAILVVEQQKAIEALQAKVAELNSTLEVLGGEEIFKNIIVTRSATRSVNAAANSWTTQVFSGWNSPAEYDYLFSFPTSSNSGVMCGISNHSKSETYVRVYALSAVQFNLTVTQVYVKQGMLGT